MNNYNDMSMINRYKFTKNIYKDYIVLIIKNKKYYSFDKDKKILDYINFNNKPYLLKKYSINFIVLDNLEILSINNYNVNNYYKYLYISYVKDILLEIRRSIRSE